MTAIPTDAELLKEIRIMSKAAPHLCVCNNCSNYNLATGECSVTKMRFLPYVRGCAGRHFVTDEELLLAKVKNELSSQAKDVDKIENLLALIISTSCAASCFCEDMEKRIKTIRKMKSHSDAKSALRKDLDATEEIHAALDRINKITEKIQKDLAEGLEKIDQQYRLYIERHINRVFTTDGKFDANKSDGNLNNAMAICRLIGKFTKKCVRNEENYNHVFAMLDNLENDFPYGLEDKDFDRYELQDYGY